MVIILIDSSHAQGPRDGKRECERENGNCQRKGKELLGTKVTYRTMAAICQVLAKARTGRAKAERAYPSAVRYRRCPSQSLKNGEAWRLSVTS